MFGSKAKIATTQRTGSDSDTADLVGGPGGLARRLAVEFSAPVGLLDPRRGLWVARNGAPAEAFPLLSPGLTAAASAHGKAMVWRGDEAGGAAWLLVPVPAEGGPLVAAAGFAASAAPAVKPSSVRWGPPCPEPALRAWGQSVADQLRASSETATRPPAPRPSGSSTTPPPRAHDDGADRQIIARLIRRLRISDPPERFQQMATNALRTALGAQAVAWVPSHH
ncbi:MAG: hypothetical protein LC745_05505, partial [Planctomycetia bacterium]|nr:hypothetical protein [Planctomycetia bacterium]